MRLIDLTGQKFSRLTVIKRIGTKNNQPFWLCFCSCGAKTKARSRDLRTKHKQSCGCLKEEFNKIISKTHGMSGGKDKSRTYTSWAAMNDRCRNKNSHKFYAYGARGIKVCKRWRNFESFLADMGLRPSLRHSLDRINNDGNYTPKNCRWATPKHQANNKRNNRRK